MNMYLKASIVATSKDKDVPEGADMVCDAMYIQVHVPA